MADEIGPVDIERRRQRRAVGVRREVAAVTGEGAAEIGDQRVAIPVGERDELRRDHVERLALRRDEPAGIGVVAAGDFDRGLDQEAAGVIADRAERIVVDPGACAAAAPTTVPAIAGGIALLLADGEDGIDSRNAVSDAIGGGGLPGPIGGFGFACPG